MPLLANSDDFVFDNQMLTQTIAFGYRVGEVSCPTKYFAEASSISFRRSVVYGIGVLATSALYCEWKWGLVKTHRFSRSPTFRLQPGYYRYERPADEPKRRASSEPRGEDAPLAAVAE